MVPLADWDREGMVWWELEQPGAQISPHAPQLPSPEKVRASWKEDALFGYQFLNGTNPLLLRRSNQLPARLVFPPGMEELQAQLEKERQVWTYQPKGDHTVKWGWSQGLCCCSVHWGPSLLTDGRKGFYRRNLE